jgi:hypothetical protein
MSTLLPRMLFGSLLVVLAATSVHAQPAIGTAPAAKATVSQLAFISGPWTGTLGDRTIEQHWSAPLGDSMVAMYRNVQDGKVRLYELLVMEQEGEGVALRIKHFAPGAGLVGRQEKDASINHRLVKVEGQTAVFEGTGANPNRVIFTRTSPDALTIRVERVRDGALAGTDFNYTKIR